jgi:hypothetical protein
MISGVLKKKSARQRLLPFYVGVCVKQKISMDFQIWKFCLRVEILRDK